MYGICEKPSEGLRSLPKVIRSRLPTVSSPVGKFETASIKKHPDKLNYWDAINLK